MKSARVARGKPPPDSNPPKTPRSPIRPKTARTQKSVFATFSQNSIPGGSVGGQGILNRSSHTLTTPRVNTKFSADKIPGETNSGNTPQTIPFSLSFSPPGMYNTMREMNQTRYKQAPISPDISTKALFYEEQKYYAHARSRPGSAQRSIFDNSGVVSELEAYKKFVQQGSPNYWSFQQSVNDEPSRKVTPKNSSGALTSRRPRPKTATKPPGTAPPQVNVELNLDKQGVIPIRTHLSRSDCNLNDLRAQYQVNANHRLPDWLLSISSKNRELADLEKVSPVSTEPKIPPPIKENPIIATVKLPTPSASNVSLTNRVKPSAVIAPPNSVEDTLSASAAGSLTPSANTSSESLATIPSPVQKGSSSSLNIAAKTPIPAPRITIQTVTTRPKSRPSTARKPPSKKSEGIAVSRAIRSAVTAIREMPMPVRVKRFPENQPAGDSNAKDKDGGATAPCKPKAKKIIKGKGKKANGKKSGKALSLAEEFMGSQQQLADQQIRNLAERQKSLEQEVLLLFEGLEYFLCSEKACGHEAKCCCSPDTQTKIKGLLSKQKEIIQLQMDMQKRYGLVNIDSSGLGSSVTSLGSNEPILNGFNAHFRQLASYAKELDGKMVYYCPVCNACCDDELSFRKHIESTKHVAGTFKGIKKTQPIFTCDDCEKKIKGTTEYMYHVINRNVHNVKIGTSKPD